MNKFVFAVLCFTLYGCNTTTKLPIPEVGVSTDLLKLQQGEASAAFALARLVSDINRGDTIFSFPGDPPTKGSLCNHRYSGDATVTYAGGSRYLGDWSSELGKIFFDTLTKLNYKVAGDPTDMFTQRDAVRSAEFLIGGRLTQLKGNFCHEHHWWDGRPLDTFSGEIYVEFDWSILNTLTKEVVFKHKTNGYFKQNIPIKNGVLITFENAFIDAVEKFGKNSTVVKLAKGERILSPIAQQAIKNDALEIVNGKKNTKFNLNEVGGSVVSIRIGQGHGSGFFIGKDGYLLTNQHVVGAANTVQVKMSNGLELPATVVASNRERDVALLKAQISFPRPPSLQLNLPNVATDVYAIGSPIRETLSNTVTKGIVSAIRTDPASGQRFIQSDTAISPGNSGGPLFDTEGNIVGIAVARYASGGATGLGLFIPIEDAINALNLKLTQ